MEVVILAGGLGTRLRHIIGDFPKCLALVNNRPFLYYLIQDCVQQGVKRIVLSLGYKADTVIDYIQQNTWPIAIDWVIESEPLGTGGGIALALQSCHQPHVLVMNGDTFLEVNYQQLLAYHQAQQALCTIAVKHMHDFERYGTLTFKASGTIESFLEKQPVTEGYINAGVYVINKAAFLQARWPSKFSFETDFLQAPAYTQQCFAFTETGYFIDIGVESDYLQAQEDFKKRADID